MLVADIDDDFIMGMDLIGKYRLAYEPEQQILSFGNEKFVLSTPRAETKSVRLYACKTARNESSSEQIINVVMGNDLGSCVELVERAEESNKHLLVAKTWTML